MWKERYVGERRQGARYSIQRAKEKVKSCRHKDKRIHGNGPTNCRKEDKADTKAPQRRTVSRARQRGRRGCAFFREWRYVRDEEGRKR